MKAFVCAVVLSALGVQQAHAWGQEGHSIIAEIAQREIKPTTRDAIDKILHHGTLAAVASWADDAKFTPAWKYTADWHFVDIPLGHDTYAPLDCKPKHDASKPDSCLVSALSQLETELACATDERTKRNLLRLVVHLIGDSTQPLHTVDDLIGGNNLPVTAAFCGLRDPGCSPPAQPPTIPFHVIWDSTLITDTFYDWGGYVDRLYDPKQGWLNTDEARGPDPGGDTIIGWINDTHAQAEIVWTKLLPSNNVLDQSYYNNVLPILDRQLGLGGLRLARFLDAVLAPAACKAP
jgi:nuclease S1